jgi:Protein of unknown function (DUF3617)
MRHRILIALSAGIVLASCGTAGGGNNSTAATTAQAAPVHRKPGSWSTKMEIPRLEGKDVKPGMREQMQQMFAPMESISLCITPEFAAQEDVSKNLEQSAGSSDCKFDKREVNGATVDFSAMCDRDGKKVRMTAHGTNSETSSDVTMTIEPVDASGGMSLMEMHIVSTYNGACKPGDLTPPPPAKEPAQGPAKP